MELSPSAHADTFCRDRLPPTELWPELLFELPELRYPDRLNCATALLDDRIAEHGPDRRCLVTPHETWTYGDLRHRASQVAQVLTEDLGLVPGNRVLLRGPNNPWLVACWFGVLRAGGVVVTTMPLLRAHELTTLAGISRPVVAISDHRFAAALVEADTGAALLTFDGGVSGLSRVSGVSGHSEVSGRSGVSGDFGVSGEDAGDAGDDLIARCGTKDGVFEPVETAADDVALIGFTSGTTGRPKATMHFHRDVLANADTFSRHVVRPGPDDLFTGTPPIGFTFGLGGLVVFPLHAGAATLLFEQATPEQLVDLVEEFGVTVLFTAPTAYRAILTAGLAGRMGAVRRCISAGEALPAAVWRDFHEACGVRIIDGIGATEMLHVFISSADDDIRPGATGREVPGFRAAVLGADGAPVADGEPGMLAVKGPTGCRYLDDERQASYVRDGWNLTGDTYIRDADGYFWYQARSDDMIVSSGYNIAGPEVEVALSGHPDVAECGVVGAPDEARGMIVKAYVVLRPGATADEATAKDLQAFVKSTVAPYKYPRAVEFVDALPRTSNGKLQRAVLRQWAAEGR